MGRGVGCGDGRVTARLTPSPARAEVLEHRHLGELAVDDEGLENREPLVAGSDEGATPARVWIDLAPMAGRPMMCDGRPAVEVHDVSERVIRDLPLFDAETFLRVPRRRVQCLRCGPRLERLPWFHRYARVTRRLAESVVRLCQQLPIKHVAAFYGLGWGAVKDLDKAALEERRGRPTSTVSSCLRWMNSRSRKGTGTRPSSSSRHGSACCGSAEGVTGHA
jgi:hypothetical protein